MRVSLVKVPHPLFGGGHNAESCYTPNPDGTVPEWVLVQRRAKEGQARITQRQASELIFNELPKLADFFGGRLYR
jgi:hypothetical protein